MTRLQDFLNRPITDVTPMARAAKVGDLFGVEIECEGLRVDFDGQDGELLKSWSPHRDGSLRDNHGTSCEWVFNGPVKYKAATKRIETLFDYFDKKKAKLVLSNRTSTHVHFNMADKSAYQLVNMFILFTIFEDVFDRYCGDDRRGNLFCLSSRHAEDQVRWVHNACFHNNQFNFLEGQRYCSFNLASLNKFGTVEFRGMRGLDNREDVLAWLSILNEFCEYACYTMRNPVTIIESISMKTPRGLLGDIFSPDNVRKLTENLSEQELNASVYEGLRLVQMLCYKIGTEFDQIKVRGRDFWASFNTDKEPELDVDPAQIMENPRPKRGPNIQQAPRGRNNPFLMRAEPAPEAPPQIVWQDARGWADRANAIPGNIVNDPQDQAGIVREARGRVMVRDGRLVLQADLEADPIPLDEGEDNEF